MNYNNLFDMFYSNTYSVPSATLLQTSLENDNSPYIKETSPDGFELLKDISFMDLSNDNVSCPITMESFRYGETITVLPCNHTFNYNAIRKWLSSSNLCPVCRYELPFTEIDSRIQSTEQPTHEEIINTPMVHHPFGELSNRFVIPHSYISFMIEEMLQEQEEEFIQDALLHSFLPTYNSNN